MDGAVDGLQTQMSTARRSVALLAGAQAVLGSAPPLVFALGGLVGYQLLGDDKSLATAPLTGFNIGMAAGAVAVAIASRFLGRKASFMLGSVLGAVGAATAAIALFHSNFWLFAVGLLLIGLCNGFTQKIRFAAADASPSFYKPKAISWILAAGIVSAVLGPQLAIWTKDLLSPVLFAGAFVAVIPLYLIALVMLAPLKLPPTTGGPAASAPARSLGEIVVTQRFLTGMICGISSYALMTFMMTGAPLAMVIGCGFPSEMATLGIQWHVLAMFAPSFFTGMLISRFGVEKIVAAGLMILMGCAVIAHMGIELWNFWGALVLLGIGWNFAFIGSTAIVASSYRPHEADKVQGFHDIILFTTVALSSFSSGKVFTAYGWSFMNLIIWPVTIVCLGLVLALMFKRSSVKSA
ncbi:MFS transporter [Neorhizobium galegae]|uniref:MFS transporter n=1 Tax=Neorhizobium galegae TaxID=399 RepID=UPI00062223A9|nr:MFS transporter [Neorhizobium galegae]CDZ27626.1 Putative drug transport transmembrane protein [Neorhizobium galegae bv. officinalis]KAA9386623.1 MFS transporter [Neorhizobium galegae]KAB1110981.1 MFS transporter [Neorhizobium galegae]MCM2498473.1 MFS transporter [Neorhizobium galegae]MCQ1772371.1 MFS transporter [Neorhizobium galegae]